MRLVASARRIAAASVVVGVALAASPAAAQDAEPIEVLVAQIGMQSAPNMGLEMTSELAGLLDARDGLVSRDWPGFVANADLPEDFRSRLPETPVCFLAMNALGFDAMGIDYLLCGLGRPRHDGVVDVQLTVWDTAGECWVFVPPVVVADRGAAVAYLDAAFADWLETGEPADVPCATNPGVSRPLRAEPSPTSSASPR